MDINTGSLKMAAEFFATSAEDGDAVEASIRTAYTAPLNRMDDLLVRFQCLEYAKEATQAIKNNTFDAPRFVASHGAHVESVGLKPHGGLFTWLRGSAWNENRPIQQQATFRIDLVPLRVYRWALSRYFGAEQTP